MVMKPADKGRQSDGFTFCPIEMTQCPYGTFSNNNQIANKVANLLTEVELCDLKAMLRSHISTFFWISRSFCTLMISNKIDAL